MAYIQSVPMATVLKSVSWKDSQKMCAKGSGWKWSHSEFRFALGGLTYHLRLNFKLKMGYIHLRKFPKFEHTRV